MKLKVSITGLLFFSSIAFAAMSHAKDVTIQVESTAYVTGTYTFSIDEDKFTRASTTLLGRGSNFAPACALYKQADANGHLGREVALELSGMALDDGNTMIAINVSARAAGSTRLSPVFGADGKLTETAECPSTDRLGFSTQAIVKPGETIDLTDVVSFDKKERFRLTVISQ
jgi:hypothetical protein